MDLNDEERLTATDCYVCGHAGWDAVIWPQSPTESPRWEADPLEPFSVHAPRDNKSTEGNWTTGKWKVYITSYVPSVSSGKKTIDVCVQHYNLLGANWIAVAQSEVDIENLWHNYMGQVER